jgi:hypothetical protein
LIENIGLAFRQRMPELTTSFLVIQLVEDNTRIAAKTLVLLSRNPYGQKNLERFNGSRVLCRGTSLLPMTHCGPSEF